MTRSPGPSQETALKGKVTKAPGKVVRVDPEKLKGIKGAHGEHRKPGDPKFDRMLAKDKKRGFEVKRPIGIGVDKGGKPFIENGNTHAAVAREMGVKKVPVQVRYYGGSEKTHPFKVKGFQKGGPVEPGNIDIHDRPVVHNPDGSISTVRSITVGFGDKTYVLPTAVGGKIVSNQEAIDHFKQTGEHLGAFATEADADAYAQRLHEDQAVEYQGKARGGRVNKTHSFKVK